MEGGEQIPLLRQQQVAVAAERGACSGQQLAGGLAQAEKAGEMGGQGGSGAGVEFEPDKLGQGGLVERVGLDGAGQGGAGEFGGAEGLEAVGDGDEVVGAEILARQEVFEGEAGFVVAAETAEGDGLQAVDRGGEAAAGCGRLLGEAGEEGERGLIFAGDEVGLRKQERGRGGVFG